MNSRVRFNSLQILRAVAFLCIFASHCLIADDGFSRWGVAVFFILSGFLNAIHDTDKDDAITVRYSFGYATKKVSKIYKLHIIMTLVAFLLLVASNWNEYRSNPLYNAVIAIFKLLTNALLISDFLPSTGRIGLVFSEYNIVSWYLSASFFFYLLTPVLVKITKRIHKPLLISVVLYGLTIVVDLIFVHEMGPGSAFWYIYECPIFRISDYMIGIQLGYWYVTHLDIEHVKADKSITYGIMLVVGTILSIATLYAGYRFDSSMRWLINSGFYYTIPAVLVIISFAGLDKYIRLPIGILVTLGNLSAYAYLIHVPVINLIHGVYKRVGNVNLYVWCSVSFAITIVLSVAWKRMTSLQKKIDE